jgi:anti-sigma factor RsiW
VIGAGRQMACQELVELVSDYLEGALTRRDRRRFERHIAGCPHCTEYLEQMRVTIRVAGALTEDTVPQHVLDDLQRAFRDWGAAGAG